MVDALLIDIVKSGTIALVGTKITKAIGEKEISEIIAGTGWTIVGINMVLMITPVVKGIQNFFDKATKMFDAMSNTFEKMGNIPILGEFIKRGIVEGANGATGGW